MSICLLNVGQTQYYHLINISTLSQKIRIGSCICFIVLFSSNTPVTVKDMPNKQIQTWFQLATDKKSFILLNPKPQKPQRKSHERGKQPVGTTATKDL